MHFNAPTIVREGNTTTHLVEKPGVGQVVQKNGGTTFQTMPARTQPTLARTQFHLTNRENMDPEQENEERIRFYHDLHNFMSSIGQPIQRLPTLGFKELDLWVLYKEVTRRRGVDAVIAKKQWKEVADALQLPASCTDSGFRLRLHYVKYLEAFERAHFDPPPEMPQVSDDGRMRRLMPGVPEKRKRGTDAPRPGPSPKLARKVSDATCEGSSFSSLITTADSPASASQETSNTGYEDGRKNLPCVDFSKLEMNTLKRYRRHYRLQGLRPNLTKSELVSVVGNHFSSMPPAKDEAKTVLDFLSAWQRRLPSNSK
mmetsp:Transcript_9711/g.29524  ORF Transcript_9711/g.29524 Transcript_9711/m.29524 type:complete len:314 (+) Transcript_9711:410-1351(+)|eukprot:CAMPEP_0198723054 /NCGR_PEP_ID=MMETSP1475-20131203/608_1 /TAXON_ID= ORGANISM="Unidentified sp., Strain CCMP1999" /NCGR_SAMPLE_ID=MMETSP1475 /ASSEMBLY_ACC=CAM_ASM_001111 /LENGTH=313 /DNA_ID=CAMNT_0044484041 /DNA_START=368 /DNA_END=1309 /DNA_ORIENTATION=-